MPTEGCSSMGTFPQLLVSAASRSRDRHRYASLRPGLNPPGSDLMTESASASSALRTSAFAEARLEACLDIPPVSRGRSPKGKRARFVADLQKLSIASCRVNRKQKSDKDAHEWGPETSGDLIGIVLSVTLRAANKMLFIRDRCIVVQHHESGLGGNCCIARAGSGTWSPSGAVP